MFGFFEFVWVNGWIDECLYGFGVVWSGDFGGVFVFDEVYWDGEWCFVNGGVILYY